MQDVTLDVVEGVKMDVDEQEQIGGSPVEGEPQRLSDRELAAAIAGLAGRLQDVQHRLLVMVGEYDRRSAWLASGATSCAVWLAELCDLEVSTAREHVRVARALMELPQLAAAFAAGDLSYAKVRVLTRVARPDTEAELLGLAAGCPASELSRRIAEWLDGVLDPDEQNARHHAARSLTSRVEPDGMVVITARLAPDVAAAITAVIDKAVARNRRAPAGASLAQQRADALVAALAGGGAKVVAEVVVHVHVRPDGTVSACLSDGTPVPGPGYSDLYDDAFVRLLLHGIDGRPLDATNRRRHPTLRQRRVIEARAGHRCEEPGCLARHFLDVHHTVPYPESHHTVTAECTLRCSFHHRRHHAGAAAPR